MFTPCTSHEEGGIRSILTDLPQEMVEPRKVTTNDLLKSLESCQRTVTKEELHQFQEFTRQMGQSGAK